MNPENYFQIGALLFLSASAFSLQPLFPRLKRALVYVMSALGALAFGLLGLGLLTGAAVLLTIPCSSIFTFSFGGDGLSGFFLIVISALAVPVSVYSIGYARHMKTPGLMGFLYSLFVLSMYAVVLSSNVITFLVSWETMSVVSYFLVTFDREEKSAKAGLLYAAMTHIGTAFIIALFLVLYKYTGRMDFAGMKAGMAGVPEGIRTLIFVFSIIGFGTKAGIIPLHTWLPRAHPAAPSNVSALMSGVMIKTGIYGFLRMSVDTLGQGPEWWGIAIIAIGALSSVVGVLYALMEKDIKRLLAYSSVENVGIILLGVGASMMFKSGGLYGLSALALTAGLYHTLNHAAFKGLLFLSAGSVVHATGTKNMEEMGGLIKGMPYTGLFFLVGSVSICALPPFNGFVSEWLTFQSLLLGFESKSFVSKIVSPLGGAALALTGALAAAGFVKAFGIPFLGKARGPKAVMVKESPLTMVLSMAALALLCLLLGLLPGKATSIMGPFVSGVTGAGAGTGELLSGGGFLYVGSTSAAIAPLLLALTLLVMGLAAWAFALSAGGRRKTTYRGSWDCGMPALTSRMQYTATAFSNPLKMIFKRIYLPRRELRVTYAVKPFFVKSIKYKSEITPFFERYFYEPLIGLIRGTASKVRLLQSGSLHLYLGYMLITLIALLVFA